MRNVKKVIVGMICAGLMISMSACNNKENNQKQEAAVTPGGTQTEQRQEPSLTKAAQKLTQFKPVKDGDTIAEIVVKDFGTLKIKLFPKQAPKAVENFTTHANDGYYDGLTFHRILEEFMIQGGDPKGDGTGGDSIWGTAFEDEFSDDLYPYRGALCMANSGANTNKSQFFIVQANEEEVNRLQDLIMERYKLSLIDYVSQGYQTVLTQKELNRFLDYGGAPWLTKHHTVFGQMIEGFDVLDAISAVKVTDENGTPQEPVVIETIRISEYKGK